MFRNKLFHPQDDDALENGDHLYCVYELAVLSMPGSLVLNTSVVKLVLLRAACACGPVLNLNVMMNN